MGSIAPCKECEKRCVGCHSSCEEYLEWRKQWDKNAKEKRFQAEVSETMYQIKRRRTHSAVKRKFR